MTTAVLTRQAVSLSTALPALIGLYLFVFLIPIEFSFYVGPLLVTPTRLFLILAAFPVMIASLRDRKLHAEDWVFLFFVVWVSIAYFYKRGLGGLEIIGQSFLETAISFFVARTFLTHLNHFQKLAMVLSITVAVLGFLAIPEAVTHYRFLHEVPELLTGFYYYISDDTRIGLLRASSAFEHPILFGLFCASMFTLAWYSFRSMAARIAHLLATLMATLLSLSSAALLLLTLQIALVGFEKVTRSFKKRTMTFGIMTLGAIVFVETFSDRGVVKLIGGNLTFNPHTAYYRVLQWEHAIDDVQRHPFVGINFAEWTKPFWMTDSIDNHWLFTAMNSGVPAVFAIWAIMAIVAVKLYRKKRRVADEGVRLMCMAWLIGAASLFLGAWTVTLFGKMLPIFMFFLGTGAAMTRLPEDAAAPEDDDGDPDLPNGIVASPFTRFGVAPQRRSTKPIANAGFARGVQARTSQATRPKERQTGPLFTRTSTVRHRTKLS